MRIDRKIPIRSLLNDSCVTVGIKSTVGQINRPTASIRWGGRTAGRLGDWAGGRSKVDVEDEVD